MNETAQPVTLPRRWKIAALLTSIATVLAGCAVKLPDMLPAPAPAPQPAPPPTGPACGDGAGQSIFSSDPTGLPPRRGQAFV